MVQHERHDLVGRRHLSRGAGSELCWGPWSRASLRWEATYLYPAHASFPMDPCGQTQALLARLEPGDSLSLFCSSIS